MLFREIYLFAFAGTVGFIADAAILYLFKGWLGLYAARVLSFLSAVATTWIINRSLTFKGRNQQNSRSKEFSGYLMVMLLGGAVNYAIYAWIVFSFEIARDVPLIALIFGSLAGMSVNFIVVRSTLFKISA